MLGISKQSLKTCIISFNYVDPKEERRKADAPRAALKGWQKWREQIRRDNEQLLLEMNLQGRVLIAEQQLFERDEAYQLLIAQRRREQRRTREKRRREQQQRGRRLHSFFVAACVFLLFIICVFCLF